MKRFLVACIRLYQRTLSPDHGWMKGRTPVCRYLPTCSEYMIDALENHGIIAGGQLGIKRICRCHPLHPGGYDPVPQKEGKQ